MGDVIENARFKKGDGRKKGRPPGAPNINTMLLKDALLIAATELGEIKHIKVLDADGQPTGEIEYQYTGHEGLVGYLKWVGVHRPASFMALLGRVLPTQLNIKTSTSLKVTYKTVEETRQALKEYGIEPAMVTDIFGPEQKRLPPPKKR
jgi:hypothetical protein